MSKYVDTQLTSDIINMRIFGTFYFVEVTFIKRSPLSSGRGHLSHRPKQNFSLFCHG